MFTTKHVISKTPSELPETISTRTEELAPLLQLWRKKNQGVNWSYLIVRALKKELKPLAGKRYAHLVEESK